MFRNSFNRWLFVGLIALSVSYGVESARILGYFPSPSKSHLIIHCSVADTLAKAGHDVTVISNFPNVLKDTKYKYITIDGPKIPEHFTNNVVSKPKPIYRTFPALISNMASFANETLAHPTMQKFLNEHGEGSFDLFITSFFMNDFNLGLAAHFKCPIAIDFMIRPISVVNALVGNPQEVSYVPLLFSGDKQLFGFLQRVKNFLFFLVEKFLIQTYMDYKSNIYYDYHFPADRFPPLAEMRRNISLLMVNHHSESQGPIRPNVPALIEIGGIQIKEKPNPLPADLLEAIDGSPKGFIYLSMGSVVKGSFLDKAKVQVMFNALSKLPYVVFWKWDDEETPGKAPNIIYKKWLPQDDILGHPKCKLFITHGGQGSIVESQYHGVPMVALPFFGDQTANVGRLVNSGFGLSVDFRNLAEDTFLATVNEVLNNPIYRDAVQRFSRIYRDRPMTPRQKLVYWVDYIIRYQGAKHLQSPAVFLNSWQLHSLDVIAFLIFVIGSVVGSLVFAFRLCCCSKKKQRARTSKSKKTK